MRTKEELEKELSNLNKELEEILKAMESAGENHNLDSICSYIEGVIFGVEWALGVTEW